ncbi:MAG TPA: 3-dehydroquinate synthase II, partial [Methanobacteriaceae archaeon]|nr:3-dehydroquinate synthase II [Methanobacteriaceae archaeon]
MKFAWVMAEGMPWNKKKGFITTTLESGIDHIVDFTDTENIQKLGNVKIISDVEDSDIFLVGRNGEGDGTIPLPKVLSESKDLSTVRRIKSKEEPVTAYVEITSKEHEQLAALLGKYADYL